MAGVIYPSIDLPGFGRRESVYDHIHGIYVDIPDRIQLYPWEISGPGSVRYLGGDGCRLGVSRVVFYYTVFQRRMEETGVGIDIRRSAKEAGISTRAERKAYEERISDCIGFWRAV